MCSSVDITTCEARKYISKPSEVKLRKLLMVRKIGEIMSRLLASPGSITLVKSSIHGLQVVLQDLLDDFLSHYLFPVCPTAVKLRVR